MIIRYIGLTKYNDIDKKIDINLGGRFNFKFLPDNKISADINKNYVNGSLLYGEVSEISAIVGKNGAGKTSVLRMISKVIGGEAEKFVLIQEDETKKQIVIESDLKLDFANLKNIIKEQKYNIEYNCIQKKQYKKYMTNEITQLYFSNIFDKTQPLFQSDNLVDISTNKELREFIDNSDEIYFEKHSIDNFRYSEIRKKMKLALFLKETVDTDMIFNLPEYINIYFVENIERKYDYIEIIKKKLNADDKKKFDLINLNISNIILQENDEDSFYKQFVTYLIQELILCNLKDDKASLYMLISMLNRSSYNLSIINEIIDLYDEEDEEVNEVEDSFEIHVDNYNESFEVEQDESKSWFSVARNMISEMEEYLEQEFFYLNFVDIEKFIEEIEELEDICSDKVNIYSLCDFIRDQLEDTLDNFHENEIEDIQEILQLVSSKLFEIDSIIQQETDENYIKISEIKDEPASFIEYTEVMNAVEGFDEKILESINEVISLARCLKDIQYLSSTGMEKENKSLNVRLMDPEVFNLYEKCITGETYSIVIDHTDLSSGQNAYLDMCARMSNCSNEIKSDRLLILLDEGELFLHPQAQTKYMHNLVHMVPMFFKDKKIQIIVSTNSPFILSDMQDSNVLYLKQLNQDSGLVKGESIGKTFGTNINTLLISNFFMQDGITGRLSKDKINELLYELNHAEGSIDIEKIRSLLEILGDELIKMKLVRLLDRKIHSESEIVSELIYHEKKVEELKNRLENIAK